MHNKTLVSYTYKAKELLKTTRRRRSGPGKQQTKELAMHKPTLVTCIPMAKELFKATRRQHPGLKKQQIKEMSMHRTRAGWVGKEIKVFVRALRGKLGCVGKGYRGTFAHVHIHPRLTVTRHLHT
jgi:hypothetical protein